MKLTLNLPYQLGFDNLRGTARRRVHWQRTTRHTLLLLLVVVSKDLRHACIQLALALA